MTSIGTYEGVWGRFQEARRELYRPPAREITERGGVELKGSIEAKADNLLGRSAELRAVLEEAVISEDPEVRELAAMKLIAAAAYDLSVAGDLLTQSERPPGAAERSVHLDAETQQELNSVLDVPLDGAGLKRMVAAERAALPTEFGPARDELDKEVAKFLKEIPQKAVALAGTAISGAITFAVPAGGLESVLGHELLDQASGALPRAAKMAIEAIHKLWSALGKDERSKVLDEAKEWLREAEDKGAQVIVGWLYQLPDVDTMVHTLVKSAPQGTDPTRLNDATRRLEQLIGRYDKTKAILGGVLRIIGFLKTALLAAVPWGPAAAYAVYALVFGYAVYAGGDYLDSPRFAARWLDHVQGLEATVRHAVS